jgi:hypothetical protein
MHAARSAKAASAVRSASFGGKRALPFGSGSGGGVSGCFTHLRSSRTAEAEENGNFLVAAKLLEQVAKEVAGARRSRSRTRKAGHNRE